MAMEVGGICGAKVRLRTRNSGLITVVGYPGNVSIKYFQMSEFFQHVCGWTMIFKKRRQKEKSLTLVAAALGFSAS